MIERFSNGTSGTLLDNDYTYTTDGSGNTTIAVPSGRNLLFDIYDELSGGVENVIQDENIRLDARKTAIDPLYKTHTRKQHFKNSIAKRNNAWWRIYMTILLLAIIITSLYLFRKNFPLIPSWAVDLILIACVAGGFIVMFSMFEDLGKRDLMDFERLDPESPVMIRDKEKKEVEENLDKGKISAAVASREYKASCNGRDCCPPGTYYDRTEGKCKPSNSS